MCLVSFKYKALCCFLKFHAPKSSKVILKQYQSVPLRPAIIHERNQLAILCLLVMVKIQHYHHDVISVCSFLLCHLNIQDIITLVALNSNIAFRGANMDPPRSPTRTSSGWGRASKSITKEAFSMTLRGT